MPSALKTKQLDARGQGNLTKRELEVLQGLANGLTTKGLARYLGLSVKTVDTHRTNIMYSAGVHTTGGLVAWAFRKGLIK